MYKLPLLKIVEKTVDFGAISIPFCAINAHCAQVVNEISRVKICHIWN